MVDMDVVMTLIVPAKMLYITCSHTIFITWRYPLILTPLLVLFLICLYISSRALSEAFEHRNFVARYQRETNNAEVASLVTMDASLQYWWKHSYT